MSQDSDIGRVASMDRWILLAIVVVATGLRVWIYVVRNALWIDEAGLALNIVPHEFAEIGRPFEFRQICPYGFMYATKVVTLVAGAGDHALRFIPLVAGLTVVPVVALLAKRAFGPTAMLLAAAFAAVSPRLIWYAAELKPYGVDAAVCAGLLTFGYGVAQARPSPDRTWAWLAVAGVAAIFLSMPAVFTLGGVGAALALAARPRSRPTVLALAAVAATWVVAAAAHVAMLQAGADARGQTEFMTAMWQRSFAPFPPASLEDVRWYVGTFTYAFADPGGFGPVQDWLDPGGGLGVFAPPVQPPLWYLAAACFGLGLVVLYRDDRVLFTMVVVQLMLLLGASAVERYPVEGRLLVFAVPTIVVVVAGGADRLLAARQRAVRWGAAAIVVALAYYPASNLASILTVPEGGRDIHDVMIDLKANYRRGDLIYVGHGLQWPFAHYAHLLAFEVTPIVGVRYEDPEVLVLGRPARILDELVSLKGQSRVWLLLPTFVPPEGVSTERYVAHALDAEGRRRLGEWRGQDVAMYLYDLR